MVRPVNKVTGTLTESGEITTRGTVSVGNSEKANKMALTAMAAVLLLPGLSWIYYGDELGMSSNLPSGESESSPHSDRFARQPFKWGDDGTAKYTTEYSFTGNKTFNVEWDNYNISLPGVESQKANPNSLLNSIRSLTELKSNYQVLKTGNYTPISLSNYSENYNVFAFKREEQGQLFEVYINMSNDVVSISNITGIEKLSIGGATTTQLPGWSVLVTSNV